MVKYLFSFLLLVAVSTHCRADQGSLQDAEKLFQSGDFEKARVAFKKELDTGVNLSPAFFFNYGTTLARGGAVGEAYVALLRASFALPFDSDTRINLRQVEQRVPAAVRSVQPPAWFDWWPKSLRTSPWQLWIAFALGGSALAFLLARSKDRTYSALASLTCLLLFLVGGLDWYQLRDSTYGVMAQVKVKSGPANTFSDIATLEPGSLVSQEATRDGWLKIRFVRGESASELVGWVEPSAVLEVR